jgi:hypothetical protein
VPVELDAILLAWSLPEGWTNECRQLALAQSMISRQLWDPYRERSASMPKRRPGPIRWGNVRVYTRSGTPDRGRWPGTCTVRTLPGASMMSCRLSLM